MPGLLEVDGARGLDEAEVARRRERYGLNRLTPRKGRGPVALFLSQFHHPLIHILLVSAVVTGVLKSWVDASVILGVVLLDAVIGFVQERNALRTVEALAPSLSASAPVLRGGMRRVIPAAGLVPWEVVFLQSGDKVPADLRPMRTRGLQIDESALTGESVPVDKATATLAANTPLADRASIAYSSTLVTYGTGVGVVVETGDRTEMGRINRLLAEVIEIETRLTRQIGTFSQWLMWFIIGLSALAFLAGWLQGEPPVDAFIASVALAVAASFPAGPPPCPTGRSRAGLPSSGCRG